MIWERQPVHDRTESVGMVPGLELGPVLALLLVLGLEQLGQCQIVLPPAAHLQHQAAYLSGHLQH
jgi:hypothetical protein